MADTEPANWIAIATFLGTLIGAVLAALAGIRRGEQRAVHGVADGDAVGLGGSPLLIDSKPMTDLTKEVAGCRRALDKLVKQREDAEDRAREAVMDGMHETMKAVLRRLEQAP